MNTQKTREENLHHGESIPDCCISDLKHLCGVKEAGPDAEETLQFRNTHKRVDELHLITATGLQN